MNLLPCISLPSLCIKGCIFTILIRFFIFSINFFFQNFILFLSNYSLVNKLLSIKLSYWNHFCNLFIHQWLSKRRLIKFIVSKFTISDQINYDIMFKFLTIFSSSSEYVMHIIKTLSINMEDWGINRFGKIRSIVSRSSFAWNGCETNLIVDNDMNCSSNSVILQVLHLHCFINNSLSGE